MRSWLMVLLLVVGALSAEEETPAEEEEEIMHVGRVIRQIVFPGQQGGFGGGGRRPGQGGGGGRPGQGGGRPGQGGGGGQIGACNCAPLVTCAPELHQIRDGCVLGNGVQAVCCPLRFLASIAPPQGTGDNRILISTRVNVNLNPLDGAMVNKACEKGINEVNAIRSTEEHLVRNNVVLPRASPAAGHLRVFKVSKRAKRQAVDALMIAIASRNMVNDFSLTAQQGGHGLRNEQVSNTVLGRRCPAPPRCRNTNSKYRSIDGSCNNQRNPAWGQSSTPLQRILPPTYDDGLMEPRRRGRNGSPLPNVRNIANNILTDVDNPDQEFTSSVMQWAQFLDHDINHTPFPSMANGAGIECCPNGQEAPANMRHPRCWPINVSGDSFFTPRRQNCMNFVRSMLAVGPGTDCTFGYAEQMNTLTHWLDGSNVYGADVEEQNMVRSFRNGLLHTSGNNHLPINPNQDGDCEAAGTRNAKCYLAGDSRVNEQPGLTAIHTVWMREHNRVARELQNLNPTWSDEAIFQEARRIVVAEMQHITYNEWLPIIVGANFVQSFGISTRTNGYSFDYNPNFNPSINNEFSTAAFRFGHTLVQGNLRLFSASGQTSTIQLRDHFNSPHLIQNNPLALDMIIRSWSQLAIQKFDSFISQELTNHLFQTPQFNFGMDLMSLNVHRGRDHGIATYNDMRQICGLRKANNFNDIKDQIPSQIADNLARVYSHVDDIDFFVGGITERPVTGGLLGWTFLCVVGDQFARLKKGDRYFYDLGGQAGSFSESQLQELKRASWARITCDNAENLQQVQPLAFQQSNNRFNQPVPCNSPQIPRPNLQLWRGERPAA